MEIMIVVSILALLAMVATPGYLRARKRSQATTLLNTLRLLDAAKELYASDFNKTRVAPNSIDLRGYFKSGSTLYNTLVSNGASTAFPDPKLANVTFWINSTDVYPSIELGGAFSDVVDTAFWSPFNISAGDTSGLMTNGASLGTVTDVSTGAGNPITQSAVSGANGGTTTSSSLP